MPHGSLIKKAINSTISFIGSGVNRKRPKDLLSKSEALKILKGKGLTPATIIDVGVHKIGTPELYKTFPESKFILVEPVEEFEQDILEICKRIKDARLIKAALSNKSGAGNLQICRTRFIHAGLVDNNDGSVEDKLIKKEIRVVTIITLDELCEKENLTGPYLIKVDVDGKDLEVLEGGVNVLRQTECVVVEAFLDNVYIRSSFLEKQGFFLWAIVDFMSIHGVQYQVDLIFLSNRYRENPLYRPWVATDFSWY